MGEEKAEKGKMLVKKEEFQFGRISHRDGMHSMILYLVIISYIVKNC